MENPKTLNEKINWLKLNDRRDIHTICADKIRVREYVTEKIGKQFLIPLVFKSYDINDLVPANLPDKPFIIKTNHDSSGGEIIRDKTKVNWKKLHKKFRKLLSKNYYYIGKEWQYKNIKPGILVEQLLVEENGQVPFDYKFHCFNGKVEVIHVDIDRYSNHKRNCYNPKWELLPFTWSMWKNNKPLWPNGKHVDKPVQLDKMITIAERLSEPFPYVRIDLYEFASEVLFGEITFHHGSGLEIIHPKEWDLKLGNLVTINKG
ncbi:ATP-grasp fold amidoligase family protein [Xanthomarina sp. F1114]|uniref:ATP-grasp fold amidoligase family protein n=1 Tax=Xanthomarina sp. F1114 TaxID=2996019 RepID=UPI00225DD241|nr:ATP-grasp fold amidoligase family protein [Xanthomarina sp. F1114]MCX7548386.1 ATP-grasp fold amidoligase family protein [Xanthomarina sp. F1114]